jgi:recombination protein RecT
MKGKNQKMTNQISPVQEIKATLQRMSDQFKNALPSHIPVDRFIRVAQTAILNNPELARAERRSLMSACTKAAEAGLLPDGKESALVTFRDKAGVPQAVFMPMTQGILKLVRNSGELKSITSHIVYKNDEFSFTIDESGEHLKHNPNFFGERGEPIGVYAMASLKDGGLYIEVMTKEQVMAVKNCARGKNGPWQGDFESEMWRKSAIKRLAKRLPLSTDLEIALKSDDDLYSLDDSIDKPKKEASPSQPSRLMDLIDDDEESQQEHSEKPDIVDVNSKSEPVANHEVPI